MALPGISFESVNSAAPTLGVRSDRTALIALTGRGPKEIPTCVHSFAEFLARFGDVVPGMIGALAARGCFENGGTEVLVARFVPRLAQAATGSLTLVGASGGQQAFPLETREPGAFGNKIDVLPILSVRKRATAQADATSTVSFAGSNPLAATDMGAPVRVVWGGTEALWCQLKSITGLEATLTADVPHTGEVLLEVFEPTFSLVITEPNRPQLVVPGLDLRDIQGCRTKLAETPVTFGDPCPALATADLPIPVAERLGDGSDGLDDTTPAEIEPLRLSFEACVRALEPSDSVDVVVAPDLWSAIWSTKGIKALAFDAATAIDLADELAKSAARSRDRVVVMDPPLVSNGACRPMTVAELEQWRASREAHLGIGDDCARDFAACFTPWIRVVAEPRYKGDDTLLVPPSAHVAGRMARTARTRGPWIATGNVAIEQAIGLEPRLEPGDEERLQDLGICTLRMSLPPGVTIQGVRSLAWPDRKAWGFLSTRRLFNFLRRALAPIGRSYVFEPNAPATWIHLRRDIEALLRDLFLKGAFAGSTPRTAFFVKVDESLNPEDARDSGVLTARVGVAPAVPMEFLVVRLVVEAGVSRVAEESITT